MKSPPQTQTTLSNSILQSLVLANTTTNNSSQALSEATVASTSPEARAAQRKRLLMILDFAMALIDEDTFDSNPSDETSEAHLGALE
jgi:hypothetical protein